MHSDLVTRVERSANSHPDRTGAFDRGLELLVADTPPVAGDRTVNEADAVRLAKLEKKNADEQARRRGRKARAKFKRLNEAMARLNEAMHLINRLIALFHKPLAAADARECKSELVEIESKLMQPMATIVFQMARTLPDMAAYWTAPIVPRDPEADSHPNHQDEC